MSNRSLILASSMLFATLPLCAQAPRPASKASPAASVKKWRTPWGDPDLQGAWTNATTTPLQRPAKWAGKAVLTPQEVADLDKETDLGTDKRPERGTAADVGGAYNRFWWDRGFSDGRTSLIYDPPVVLADEPTASLDAAAGAAVTETLARLAADEGRTVIAVSHDPALIARCTTRLALDHGRLVIPQREEIPA